MKAIASRIRRLQGRLCPDHGEPQHLWFLTQAGCDLALDLDRCTEMLDECGFLPTSRFGIVNLCEIPDGLNAQELETFLRRNGAEICGFGRDQEQSVPSGASRLYDSRWSKQAQVGAG